MTEAAYPEVASVHRRETCENALLNGSRSLHSLCSAVALIFGAAAAWASRTTMYPDGVSYLDIADAYWRGDWHNALNGYWSPLYSWILGSALKLFNPSITTEFPLVHVVNFLMYVVALVCFGFFLEIFITEHRKTREQQRASNDMGLPLWAMYVAGYSVFLTSSLFLITISFTSADMLVTAVVYFAAGVLLRIRHRGAGAALFATLGFVLGIGYYGKTAMFPIGFIFLVIAGIAQGKAGKSLKPVLLGFGVFLAIAGPFITALSISKRRPTFGDSGTINYTVNVGTVQFFMPREPGMLHPVTRIPGPIEAYEYAQPIAGTYPLWYDPSYWHQGISPHVNLKRQLRTIALAFAETCWICFNVFLGLHLSVAILFLYVISPKPSACFNAASTYWTLWIPALAGILMYGLVVIEPRYLGAQFCILWIVAFAGVTLPRSTASNRLITTAVLLAAFVTCAIAAREIWRTSSGIGVGDKNIATPECPKVAAALLASGVHSGDKIVVVSDWLFPSREGAYVARLARVQIIGEVRPAGFWAADESTRAELSEKFASEGATAAFTHNPPVADVGWQRLSDTNYYVYVLTGHSSIPAPPPNGSGPHADAR